MSFWYEADKPIEAIQLSNELNMPLLLFSSDDTSRSRQFQEIFDSGAPNHVIEGNYIALKVIKGTESYESTASILNIPKVPSIGIYLQNEIRALIDEVDSGAPKLIEDLSSALNIIKRVDQGESVASIKESLGESSTTTLNLKPLTAEEKAKRKEELQKKLEERRKERLEKEKEEQRIREKARRGLGKDLNSARVQQQEKEMKQIAEKKMLEKKEEREARRRVKEQIEQDKRERAAMKAKNSQLNEQSSDAVKPNVIVEPKNISKSIPDEAKLSIRLLDGSVTRATFPKDAKLQAVYDHVLSLIHEAQFKLALGYPMKVYQAEDMNKSLFDLGLCPSNSLVVKVFNLFQSMLDNSYINLESLNEFKK